MAKKKKIAIVAIIVTILCITFGALKIKEAEKIETISKNASEEKIQSKCDVVPFPCCGSFYNQAFVE